MPPQPPPADAAPAKAQAQTAPTPLGTSADRPRIWSRPTARVFRRFPGLWLVPAVFFVAAAFDGAITSGPIICVFRLGSGLPCAGCGMTRGFVAIAHGHPFVAMHYNLLAPAAFTWLTLWWLVAVARLWRGLQPPRHPAWLVKGALVVMVSYWVVRAGWFASQPGAWQDMVDTSPVLRVGRWLVN